jgi:hypothetical protein
VLCVITYLVEVIWNPIVYYIAFNPANIFNMPWQFITSLFAHANPSHLFVNMITLLFFGTKLEKLVGSRYFLIVFFISGVMGNIVHLMYAQITGLQVSSLGASGAICGVLGTLMILKPNMKIMIIPIPFPIKLRTAILLFAIFEIICIIFSILPFIGHDAHLGGLFTGLVLGKIIKNKLEKNGYGLYLREM